MCLNKKFGSKCVYWVVEVSHILIIYSDITKLNLHFRENMVVHWWCKECMLTRIEFSLHLRNVLHCTENSVCEVYKQLLLTYWTLKLAGYGLRGTMKFTSKLIPHCNGDGHFRLYLCD